MAGVVYYSVSNKTRRFVSRINDKHNVIELSGHDPFIQMTEPFICIVPSYEQHVLPDVYDSFEDFFMTGNNVSLCKGLFAAGNRNFAELFGVTAHELRDEFGIDILHYFEFQGSDYDLEKIEKELDNIDSTN